MRRVHFIVRLIAVLCVLALIGRAEAQPAAPNIAAASNLQAVLPDIVESFRRDTSQSVRLTFGSSGNFVRQIQQGAPFELFLSADEEFADRLAESGLAAERGRVYAVGRLALFAPTGSPMAVDAELAGLKAAANEGGIRRFAIANPEHAPYGRAAEQVLRRHGLWEALKPVLVLGENVAQAAQFAASGSAQGGLVPYSLVLGPGIGGRGTYALLPAEWHDPIAQKMVLLPKAGAVARRFYRYVLEPAAQAIFRRHGFALPPEN